MSAKFFLCVCFVCCAVWRCQRWRWGGVGRRVCGGAGWWGGSSRKGNKLCLLLQSPPALCQHISPQPLQSLNPPPPPTSVGMNPVQKNSCLPPTPPPSTLPTHPPKSEIRADLSHTPCSVLPLLSCFFSFIFFPFGAVFASAAGPLL